MAKLKCGKHDRRVQVLPDGVTLHRQDGSRSATKYVTIGRTVLTVAEITGRQNEISDDIATLMLGHIFQGNVPAGVRLVPLRHLTTVEAQAEEAERDKTRHPRRRKSGHAQKANTGSIPVTGL